MTTRTSSLLSPGPLALAGLILMAALSRLIPHPPNFSPVEAVALFGGAYFANRSWALIVPLFGMFVSDLALSLLNGGIYFDYFMSAGFALIYVCIALSALLGFGLRGKVGIGRVIGYSLLGSILFFLVTNFGTWLGANMYPHTGAGLLAAYAAGIPFFQNTVVGTLFYSGLLFGTFAYLRRQHPVLRLQTA